MMNEKTRFAVVAVTSLVAGSAITALIDRFALRQDLEFLGMANNLVEEATADLHKIVDKDDDDDSPE
jgi:hypothetical protein